MKRARIFLRLLKPGRFPAMIAGGVLGTWFLTGCAGHTPRAEPGPHGFVVVFKATRTVDHAPLLAVALPINMDAEASLKTNSKNPAENSPALPKVLARLKRLKPPGVYELVTRVSVREAIRNKKGKLKVTKRDIGALVPTRLGETQAVSLESDPIHLEARLERR